MKDNHGGTTIANLNIAHDLKIVKGLGNISQMFEQFILQSVNSAPASGFMNVHFFGNLLVCCAFDESQLKQLSVGL